LLFAFAAGLKAIYLSGWQVAGDANTAMQTYPDQSLYPADSVPKVVERINNAFQRADQIQHSSGKSDIHWFAPIVADAEAGFGGNLNAYELMRALIKAGAAGVHFEDQLASAKKCGHMGGKVLVPTSEFVQKLQAARLAADVSDVPTVIIARTDALGAYLLTSDIDERDRAFCTGECVGGHVRGGLWCVTCCYRMLCICCVYVQVLQPTCNFCNHCCQTYSQYTGWEVACCCCNITGDVLCSTAATLVIAHYI
jgi:isocitrate lyase